MGLAANDPAETGSFLQGFQHPFQKQERVFADNPREFIEACQDLQWTHDANTAHRSETSWIAERGVRLVKEGTWMGMIHSGFPDEWWGCAMEC